MAISNLAAFSKNKCGMIYIMRLADNSRKIIYLIFFRKFGKMLQNLPSAAVLIGALRVNLHWKSSKVLLALQQQALALVSIPANV